MAILVLRWEPGYESVNWLAEWITKFMGFAYDGAAVIFGDPYMVFHAFAFMVSYFTGLENVTYTKYW